MLKYLSKESDDIRKMIHDKYINAKSKDSILFQVYPVERHDATQNNLKQSDNYSWNFKEFQGISHSSMAQSFLINRRASTNIVESFIVDIDLNVTSSEM